MEEPLNPYNSSKPGNLFTGYEKTRNRMMRGLRSGRSYAVFGGRRCGKTSLLLQLASDIETEGLADFRALPRFLDIQARIPRSASDFFRTVAELTVQGTGIEAWKGSAASQPYQGFLKYLDGISASLETEYGANWLVVLLVDELDLAAHYLPDDETFHNLRNLLMASRYSRHYRVVASGVGGLGDLITAGSPLNNLEQQALTHLRVQDARKLIAEGFGVSLTPEQEGRLVELTGCHPYLAQGVLEYLWEEREDVDEAAINSAVRQFVRNRDGVFLHWLRGFGQPAFELYKALAETEADGMAEQELRKRLPRGASFDGAISVLSYHGVLDDTDYSRPKTNGVLFRDWFRQNHEAVAWGTGDGGTVQAAEPEPAPEPDARSSKHVFLVYGRDRKFYSEVCLFLRALQLVPLEWNEIVEATGKGAPTIFEILEQGFSMAKAAVVLLTPDDEGRLRDHFHQPHDPSYETETTPQPRPNVLFEAGMAMAEFPDETILVRCGQVRPFSDISGIYMLDLDNSAKTRDHFAKRLENCGCAVDRSDSFWQTAGDLQATEPK